MNRNLLLGTAFGAGLATLSFLGSMLLSKSARDGNFVLSTSVGGEDQAVLIAAAGKCMGRFKAETSSHLFAIAYPLRDLSKDDMVCLIEEAGPSRHDTWIQKADNAQTH